MKKVFIYHHSCTLRSLDASRIQTYFSQNNYTTVNKPQDADIIFFIGCAAGDNVAGKSLQMVKEFQKYDAELIVAGCLPIIEKEKLGNIFNVMVRLIRARVKIGMPYKHFSEPPETHAVDNLKLIYQSFLKPEDIDHAVPSLIGINPEVIKEKFNLIFKE